jgi:hypothetical protein
LTFIVLNKKGPPEVPDFKSEKRSESGANVFEIMKIKSILRRFNPLPLPVYICLRVPRGSLPGLVWLCYLGTSVGETADSHLDLYLVWFGSATWVHLSERQLIPTWISIRL